MLPLLFVARCCRCCMLFGGVARLRALCAAAVVCCCLELVLALRVAGWWCMRFGVVVCFLYFRVSYAVCRAVRAGVGWLLLALIA